MTARLIESAGGSPRIRVHDSADWDRGPDAWDCHQLSVASIAVVRLSVAFPGRELQLGQDTQGSRIRSCTAPVETFGTGPRDLCELMNPDAIPH